MTKSDLTLPPITGPGIKHSQMNANFLRLMYWSGAWTAGTYEQYEVVTNKGDTFICVVASTTTEPGTLAGLTDWSQFGGEYLELWTATPVVSMSLTTLIWTHVPLFTGQPPLLLSHAAGVLTFESTDAAISLDFTGEISHEIAANNSESSFSITPTYPGAGVKLLNDFVGSFQSTRIGSFAASTNWYGVIIPNPGDTMTVVGDSTGTNGSDVDLTNLAMIVQGPPS